MSETVTILRITPITGHGNLRGFADVKIGEITICDCRIVQQLNQAAYVVGPQKQERGRWRSLVKLSPELRQRVQETVLTEWGRRQEIGGAT